MDHNDAAPHDETSAARQVEPTGPESTRPVDRSTGTDQRPDFGPSGYLPPRASARARKIVLRAPLGLQWVIGAILAGAIVVVAGVVFLTSSGPPEAPFVATVAMDDVEDAAALVDLDALLVTAGGPAVAFADADGRDLAWCAASRRVEGTLDGTSATWHAGTGRGFGVTSLDQHPLVVHEGIAYVDPSRRLPGPRPSDDVEPAAC